MWSHRPVRRATVLVLIVGAIGVQSSSAVENNWQVIATTGGQFQLSALEAPSINDNGMVAFRATTRDYNGEEVHNIYASNAAGQIVQLMNDIFEHPPTGDVPRQELGATVVINNQNQVLAWRYLTALVQIPPPPLGSFQEMPLTYIEAWPAGGVNSRAEHGVPEYQVVMGDAGMSVAPSMVFFVNPATAGVYPSPFLPVGFSVVFRDPTMNNYGQAAFSALYSGSQMRVTWPHTSPAYQGGGIGFAYYPSMADTGDVAFSSGYTLRREAFNFSSLDVIAGSATGFTRIGLRPQISTDGQTVAFYGENAQGPGMFLARRGPTGWLLIRIAGISGNGILDPGETYVDANANGVFDPGEVDQGDFSAFAGDSSVTVTPYDVTQAGRFMMAFLGTDTSGLTGLYLSTLDLSDPGKPEATHKPIVRPGDTIAGLSGPVQSVAIHDPLNSSGQLAFAVQTAGEQAIVCSEFRKLDFVDPFFGLLVDAADPSPPSAFITADRTALTTGGRLIRGAAADGLTQVLLRARVEGPGVVTFSLSETSGTGESIGQLSALAGSSTGTSIDAPVEAIDVGNKTQYIAFALFSAPADFCSSPTSPAADLRERQVTVGATYTPTGGQAVNLASRELALVRPPVVLIHGLWSNRDTWDWPLMQDSRFTVYTVDYSTTAADPFLQNLGRPRAGIDSALTLLRDKGLAGTRADIFGHSMGGLLSRLHVTIGAYHRKLNYRAGDVHKLVTVDTPHLGSPLADVLLVMGNTPLFGSQIRTILKSIGMCIDCGAVRDLSPRSAMISQLKATNVPVHAVFGKGGSDIVELGLIAMLPPPYRLLVATLEFFGLAPEDWFPPGLQHDMIVGRISQEGGLGTGASQTTPVEFDLGTSLGVHITVTNMDAPAIPSIDLLNTSVNHAPTFASGFPGNGPGVPIEAAERVLRAANGQLMEGLAITSPAPGLIIEPGSSLTIRVAGTSNFVPDRVLISCPFAVAVVESPPFDGVLTLPETAWGTMDIQAIAFDANGNFAVADPVTINMQSGATVTALKFEPNEIILQPTASIEQLHVVGTFSDGHQREISSAGLGTTYTVDNPRIVTVDAEGKIASVGIGIARVTAHFDSLQATVRVRVMGLPSCPGDLDGDSDTDQNDFQQFQSCATGPAIPVIDIACLTSDLDGDSDVDQEDFGLFQRCFGGSEIPANPNRAN